MNQPHAPQRPRKKSYHWFCLDNSFPGHKKWRYIARVLNMHICFVQAIVTELLAYANKTDGNKARGSLEGWSAMDCAGACDLSAEDCARVYAELEDKGWIIDGYIVNFDEHQFTGEHPDAVAARKRRQRAKIDEQKDTFDRARKGLPPREATPARPAVDADKVAAQYWLQTTGKDVVIGRTGVRALAAEGMIARWLREVLTDAQALQDIIRSAVQENLEGDAFRNVVDQRVASMKRLKTAGAPLPFPPTVQKGGAAG